MRLKTFLLLLVGVLALAAFVLFYTQNKELLDQKVSLFGWETPVFQLLVLSFLAGMVVMVPVLVLRDTRAATDRWRQRRALREQTLVEESYRTGVDAVVHRRRSEAESAFRSILERRPTHRNALIALGDVLRGQGRYEEAAECHRKAIRQDEQDLEAHYALAEDHVAAGDLNSAEAVFKKILSLWPKRSVGAHEQLRDLYVTRGQWEKALEVQDRLERLPMANAERKEHIRNARVGLEYEVARLAMTDGDNKGAVARLKKLIKAHPDFTPAYIAIGDAAHALGHDDEAISWLRDGFSRTGSPAFLTRLEDHYLDRQQPAAAIRTFRDLAGQRKSDVLPRFFLGRLFSRLEMTDEACDVFTELQSDLPDSPAVSFFIARVHERRGQFEEACRLYRKVLRGSQSLRMWYRCDGCGREVAGWQAYCLECHAWDTFRVEWTEPTSPRELDVGEGRPIWVGRDRALPEAEVG